MEAPNAIASVICRMMPREFLLAFGCPLRVEELRPSHLHLPLPTTRCDRRSSPFNGSAIYGNH